MPQMLDEKVQVRIPKDLIRQLDAMAKSKLMSRSDVVREAILARLKK